MVHCFSCSSHFQIKNREVLDGLDEDNRVRVEDIKKAATTTTYVAVTSTVDIGQMINKEMLAFLKHST